MIVQEKLGNVKQLTVSKTIDWLMLEWYETNKRILHKHTQSGQQISIKFLKESPKLTDGDILFEDENSLIVVDIIPADAIIIFPSNMYEMAAVCYEIGNKHLPLFFEDDVLIVPFDLPLFRLLTSKGYNISEEQRKLLHPLQTTVAAHGSSIAILSDAVNIGL